MKNNCDMATTPPMKNPTAMELWNFRIIMVPPMLNTRSIIADQTAANPSANVRVDMTTNESNVNTAVTAKMEYLCPVESTRTKNVSERRIPGAMKRSNT